MANTGEVSHLQVGDHNVELSKLGLLQAREVGHKVGLDFIRDSLIFCSPYRRARQTLQELLHTVGLKASDERKIFRVYEDPRLREVEHGYEDIQAQEHMRKTHGWFYYRFQGGESPADCYDRTSIFMESLMRQVERKCKTQKKAKVLIVSHGITIRCFVMRFLHLTVEDFDIMENPGNCDVVTIGPKHALLEGSEDCVFQSGRWAVAGLKLRDQTEWPQKFPYSSFVRLID
jgi:broad specificity phosphatase PhoE